ncbi:MAG: hypothetical protein GY705_05780 [Bacteroidetes bacterium]|nr:hypothetical protein [Bacteroidota bacterium]
MIKTPAELLVTFIVSSMQFLEMPITEIVGGLVTKLNMPLGDFVEVVNNISDPAWQ